MNKQSLHLSDAQIERYGKPQAVTEAEESHAIGIHLDNCSACCARWLASQRAQFTLVANSPLNTFPSPDCPREDDLRSVAAGLCPPDQAARLAHHAALCDHCGALLLMYTEDFSETSSPEDEAVLEELKSASDKWQKKLIQKMLGSTATVNQEPGNNFQRWTWGLALTTTAACILIGISIWYLQRETPEKIEKLLAQAYMEQRTIEYRFQDVRHGAMSQERAGNSSRSRMDTSGALLEAESRLKKHHNDPNWLQAQTRADMLEWKLDPAISGLEALHLQHPENTDITRDLAIAYAMRFDASNDGRPMDMEHALELLSACLQANPADKAALFNRAILAEKHGLFPLAIQDWEHLLKIETDAAWAEEARTHLQRVKKKLGERRPQSNLYLNPHDFLESSQITAGIHHTSEQYLDSAMRVWLAKLVSQPKKERGTVSSALRKLSVQIWLEHHDRWLADLLEIRNANSDPGLKSLSEAYVANLAGAQDKGLLLTREAEKAFLKGGNRAGVLRARLERVFSLHRLARGQECMDLAISLEHSITGLSYVWLQGQLALEECSCWNLLNDTAQSRLALEKALQQLKPSGYQDLYMRARTFQSSSYLSRGAYNEALQSDLEALALFWSGDYPEKRGYQIYTDMAFPSESAGWYKLSSLISAEALAYAERSPNIPVQLLARVRYAKDLARAGEYRASQTQYEKVLSTLKDYSKDSFAAAYTADAKIGLANLSLTRGDPWSARELLVSLQPLLQDLQSQYLRFDFYDALSSSDVATGRDEEAEITFQRAAAIYETTRIHASSIEQDEWQRRTSGLYRRWTSFAFQHSPERAFAIWMRYKQSSSRPPLCPPDTIVISFAQLEDHYVAWVWNQTSLRGIRLPVSASRINALSAHLLELAASPDADQTELAKVAEQLNRAVVQPLGIGVFMAEKQLAFIPDSHLAEIPPDLLPFGKSKNLPGTPLNIVVLAPGITPPAVHQARETGGLRTLVLRGKTAAGQIPLSDVQPEIDAIASHISTNVLDESVTPAPVSGSYTTVHYAGHSFVQQEDRDRLVDAAVTANAKLVFLASCRSAEDWQAADPAAPGSLVARLLQQDILYVIASRWDVNSRITAELTDRFYSHLAKGKSATTSLWLAKAEIRALHPQPYYWAAYSIFQKI